MYHLIQQIYAHTKKDSYSKQPQESIKSYMELTA